MRDQYYEAALAMVKRYGYEGDELPRFSARETPSRNCPIAVALTEGTGHYCVWGYTAGGSFIKEIDLLGEEAKMISTFVERVDTGHYPELDYRA